MIVQDEADTPDTQTNTQPTIESNMFLAEPQRTAYDLNFNFLGFPIRVHPAFFIMPLILGQGIFGVASQLGVNTGVSILVLTIVFFLSILVHELGHAIAFRYYGIQSHIVLYWMGGLAIPGRGGAWSQPSAGRLNPTQQIVISLAGPAFGFLLAGAFFLGVKLMGGQVLVDTSTLLPQFIPVLGAESMDGGRPALWIFFYIGIWANVFWNILNLMPVHPLDGGQVARELFTINDPRNGIRNSLFLSIGVAGLLAVYGFTNQQTFLGFFFGFMAFSNYQALQMHNGGYGGGRPW